MPSTLARHWHTRPNSASTCATFETAGIDQIILLQQAGRNKHAHICESLELWRARSCRSSLPKALNAIAARRRSWRPYIEKALARKQRMAPHSPTPISRWCGRPSPSQWSTSRPASRRVIAHRQWSWPARRSFPLRLPPCRQPLSQVGGLRACATPEGVPVAITSPGSSVMNSDSSAMMRALEKDHIGGVGILHDLAIDARHDAQAGSARRQLVGGHDPRPQAGPVASKFLPAVHCELLRWKSRTETSLKSV